LRRAADSPRSGKPKESDPHIISPETIEQIKATLLRTGKELTQVNNWGFELLLPDEQRLRVRNVRVGDVVKLELVK
jgi:hypothetical protein